MDASPQSVPCERCAAPVIVRAEMRGGKPVPVWLEIVCECEAAGAAMPPCMPRVPHTAERCRALRNQREQYGHGDGEPARRHPAFGGSTPA